MTDLALVTGGTGFLGQHLVEGLLAEGFDVVVTSRRTGDDERSQVARRTCDLSDISDAKRLIGELRPTVVYHLAGAVGADPAADLVRPMLDSHVVSAVNVMLCAQEFGCSRVILTGSLTEAWNGVPSSPYGAAKTVAGLYARMFYHLYDCPVAVLRPFMTFGPGQKPNKVIPYTIRALAEGQSPQLSSGNWQADWIFVSDVIDAFVKAASAEGIDGSDIDLGRGKLLPLRDIVDRIVTLMGSSLAPSYGARTDRPDENERAAQIEPARSLLGWSPVVDVDDGLVATIRSIAPASLA